MYLSTLKMYLGTIGSTFQLASNFFYPDNQTRFLNKNNLTRKQQTTSTVTWVQMLMNSLR